MTLLRMLNRVFMEAGLGIWRSGWLNLVVISILTSTLLVFGIMFELSVCVKKVAVNILGSQNEFSIYLKENSDPKKVSKKLRKFKEISGIRIKTKEQAWEETKKLIKLDLAAKYNDMPDALIIKVKKPAYINYLIQELKDWGKNSELDHIQYAPEPIVKKLNLLKNVLVLSGTFVSALLAIATFVINFNTIELVIRARRAELKLLTSMGITSWFIRGPFVVQGIFYGLVSASIAGLILSTIDSLVRYNWGRFVLEQLGLIDFLWASREEFSQILFVLTLMGIVFSSSSSFWATKKRVVG